MLSRNFIEASLGLKFAASTACALLATVVSITCEGCGCRHVSPGWVLPRTLARISMRVDVWHGFLIAKDLGC